MLRARFLVVFIPAAVIAFWYWHTHRYPWCVAVGTPSQQLSAAVSCTPNTTWVVVAGFLVYGAVFGALFRDWEGTRPPEWAVGLCAFAAGALAGIAAAAATFYAVAYLGTMFFYGSLQFPPVNEPDVSGFEALLMLVWLGALLLLPIGALLSVADRAHAVTETYLKRSLVGTSVLVVPATAVATVVGVAVAALVVMVVIAVAFVYALMWAVTVMAGFALIGAVASRR